MPLKLLSGGYGRRVRLPELLCLFVGDTLSLKPLNRDAVVFLHKCYTRRFTQSVHKYAWKTLYNGTESELPWTLCNWWKGQKYSKKLANLFGIGRRFIWTTGNLSRQLPIYVQNHLFFNIYFYISCGSEHLTFIQACAVSVHAALSLGVPRRCCSLGCA